MNHFFFYEDIYMSNIPLNLEIQGFTLKRITKHRPAGDHLKISNDMNTAIHASSNELSARFSWMHPKPPTLWDSMMTYKQMAEKDEKGKGYYFAVYVHNAMCGDTFIAFVSLEGQELCLPAYSIGYWCATPHAGKGFVTNAVYALCNFAIHTLKAKRIDLTPDVDNAPSINIADKLVKKFGFEYIGVKKNAWRHVQDDSLRHCAYYAFSQPD